jgi:hypothetical protein
MNNNAITKLLETLEKPQEEERQLRQIVQGMNDLEYRWEKKLPKNECNRKIPFIVS